MRPQYICPLWFTRLSRIQSSIPSVLAGGGAFIDKLKHILREDHLCCRLCFGLLLGHYDTIHHIRLSVPRSIEALLHQGAHSLSGGDICFFFNFLDLHRSVTNRWSALGLEFNGRLIFSSFSSFPFPSLRKCVQGGLN